MECAICLSDAPPDEVIATESCGGKHSFHKGCIEKAIRHSGIGKIVCPLKCGGVFDQGPDSKNAIVHYDLAFNELDMRSSLPPYSRVVELSSNGPDILCSLRVNVAATDVQRMTQLVVFLVDRDLETAQSATIYSIKELEADAIKTGCDHVVAVISFGETGVDKSMGLVRMLDSVAVLDLIGFVYSINYFGSLAQQLSRDFGALWGVDFEAALRAADAITGEWRYRHAVRTVVLMTGNKNRCAHQGDAGAEYQDRESQLIDLGNICYRIAGGGVLNVVGFGDNHDPELCAHMAKCGAGSYRYIPEGGGGNEARVFPEMLGKMLGCVSKRDYIVIRCADKGLEGKGVGTAMLYRIEELASGEGVVYHLVLGRVSVGDVRDVALFQKGRVAYVKDGCSVDSIGAPERSGTEVSDVGPDAINRYYIRVVVANAFRRAAAGVRSGNRTGATLDDGITRLKELKGLGDYSVAVKNYSERMVCELGSAERLYGNVEGALTELGGIYAGR